MIPLTGARTGDVRWVNPAHIVSIEDGLDQMSKKWRRTHPHDLVSWVVVSNYGSMTVRGGTDALAEQVRLATR